jgi:hypothetical protein
LNIKLTKLELSMLTLENQISHKINWLKI